MHGRDTLDVFDFGTLFQSLVRTLKTGTLRVSSGETEKYLYMNGGKIEAVFTSQSRFLLGHILVHMRALDREDLRVVLERQKSAPERRPLGESLVAAGLIEASVLDEAVLYQVMEELLEVFYWESPRYQFYPGSIDESLPEVPRQLNRVGATLAVDEVLLYVTKTMDDIARFQVVCPSLRDIYVPLVGVDRLKAHAACIPDDLTIFNLLDGRRSVADLFNDLTMTQYDAMERLCELRNTEFIRPLDRDELMELATKKSPPLGPELRLSMIIRARELGATDPALWVHSARALEELGQTEDAIEEWLRFSRRSIGGGQTDAAIRGAEEAIRLGPEHLPAFDLLLSIYAAEGRDAPEAEVLSELARIHNAAGNAGKAAAALERAAELAPRNEAVLLARASSYELAGVSKAAGDAYLDLGRLRVRRGILAAAGEAFAKAVELCPASVQARDALIGFYIQKGEGNLAAQEIQDLIPMLISSGKDQGTEPAKVLQSLRERLIESESQSEPVVFYLVDAAVQCGLSGFAVDLLKEATVAARARGKLPIAARAVTKALELRPTNIALLSLAAEIHGIRGDVDAAAIQHRALAATYAFAGDVIRQEEALRDLLACAPFDAKGIEILTDLLIDRGAKVEAAEHTFRLGHLHCAIGRTRQAVECFDRAWRLVPSESRYGRFLSVALAEVLGKGDNLSATVGILDKFREQGDHLAVLQATLPPMVFGLTPPIRRSAVRESYQELGKLF